MEITKIPFFVIIWYWRRLRTYPTRGESISKDSICLIGKVCPGGDVSLGITLDLELLNMKRIAILFFGNKLLIFILTNASVLETENKFLCTTCLLPSSQALYLLYSLWDIVEMSLLPYFICTKLCWEAVCPAPFHLVSLSLQLTWLFLN